MVGGAGDPNHSAWGRVLEFLLKKLVLQDFLSPAFTGVLLQKQLFCPKENYFISRPREVGFSRAGEILGRETPIWAAQVFYVL